MLGVFKRIARGFVAKLLNDITHLGTTDDQIRSALGQYRPPKGKGKGKGATGLDMARSRGYVR